MHILSNADISLINIILDTLYDTISSRVSYDLRNVVFVYGC